MGESCNEFLFRQEKIAKSQKFINYTYKLKVLNAIGFYLIVTPSEKKQKKFLFTK